MTTPTLVCPPAWAHVPEHVGTYGDEVADLAESCGLTLDPEQRLVIDAMYAHDARGRLVSTEFGCCAPRQNIKTHVGKAASLADLVLFDEPQALWTAHLRATSDQTHTELVDTFENYDHLRRLVHSTPNSDGEQAIVLRRPGVGRPHPTLRFMTRSERGGRGLTGRRVTFDEALFLKPAMLAAMVPILSAQSMTGAVQVRYLGSPGLLHSASWRDVRDRGRRGDARRLAWFEWAARRKPCEDLDCGHAPGTPGCALDDPELVREANLAIGRRMDLDFVLGTEREAFRSEPWDYMRERLGWWQDPPEGGGVVDLGLWAQLEVEQERDDQGRVAAPQGAVMAVEVALDRSRATIGAAWWLNGRPHVERVETRRGVDWVTGRLEELRVERGLQLVVLDGGAEAGTLQPAIEALEVQVLKIGSAERAAACAGFHDATAGLLEEHGGDLEEAAATGRLLSHWGNPALADAIVAARWEGSGDRARTFVRHKAAGDIAALYSVTFALYGLLHAADVDPEDTIW